MANSTPVTPANAPQKVKEQVGRPGTQPAPGKADVDKSKQTPAPKQ